MISPNTLNMTSVLMPEWLTSFGQSFKLVALYRESLLEGFFLTMQLGLSSLIVALLFGIISALFSLSRSRILRGLSLFYTTIVRGIPDIVWIFILYFGGQILLNSITETLRMQDLLLSPFFSGIMIIGFIFGAFLSETFRGALMAIPKGQMEASIALGLPKKRIYFRIIFPQAMRYALPGISNNWLVMLKTTALISLIGLQDLVFFANNAGKAERVPFTFLFVICLGYLAFTTISILIIKYLEKRYSAGIKGLML